MQLKTHKKASNYFRIDSAKCRVRKRRTHLLSKPELRPWLESRSKGKMPPQPRILIANPKSYK